MRQANGCLPVAVAFRCWSPWLPFHGSPTATLMPSTLMPATSSYDAAVFLRQFSGLIFAKLAPAVSLHVSSAAKRTRLPTRLHSCSIGNETSWAPSGGCSHTRCQCLTGNNGTTCQRPPDVAPSQWTLLATTMSRGEIMQGRMGRHWLTSLCLKLPGAH